MVHFEHQNQLETLINKYKDLFSQNKYDVGIIKTERCHIPLTNDNPINLRPYRCSIKDKEIIEDQIQNLLKHGMIRKSVSSYSFPVTLVKKKDEDEKTRLCIDYRKLNLVTIPDNYPFPRIEDIIDQLHGCKFYTILDMCSGFWHLRIHSKDVYKTAFVTQDDHYEWLVMPFGFRNSPASFQSVIHNILKKHNLSSFAKNYLDDILIHSTIIEEHLQHL